ncbi:NADH-quinone oxidoreductase subunit NuoE family protein [Candidatus Cetobacterium colombiensis]|uniref:NAD(P)H-dependent oxidoreductase subunit E n=1 Tax=Candidatus Cetobacterium colombiensis TaxID=3073100 RepID=A0ABU4W7Z7_9FUSO|nr:NAD(P)H-dependent oxidoreductase subunit E [Candidatus Cetobacterium colombiensis]MDX8335643.1 NAD(P)H-dependent oxidoreductase subunit E [Candidatus Cetobacterium colombiensis]
MAEKITMREKYLEFDNFLKFTDLDREQLIIILRKAQNIFGYIPRDIQSLIAKKLRIPIVEIYGVITFYSYFITEPEGKYPIHLCMGTACYINKSESLLKEIKIFLNIDIGQITEDGLFSLSVVRCFGACALAPVVSINGNIYSKLTPESLVDILKKYKEEKI